MSRFLRKHQFHLRALSAVLLFFAGWVAIPVKLMLPSPVTCGMECCEKSGVCYCSMRHSASSSRKAAGHDHHDHSDAEGLHYAIDGSQPVKMAKVTIASSCPVQCAQIPAGFQNIPITSARIPEARSAINSARLIYIRAPHFARDALIEDASVPRAPPAILL
jgi:hypothetical protein